MSCEPLTIERRGLSPISPRRKKIEDDPSLAFGKMRLLARGEFDCVPSVDSMILAGLKCTGLYNRGVRNALDIRLNRYEIDLAGLPKEFDGLSILFSSDIHLPGPDGQVEKMLEIIEPLEFDLCLLGGDYCHGFGETIDQARDLIAPFIDAITAKAPAIGILGNHDTYRMAEFLEDRGVMMLVNDAAITRCGDAAMAIVGTDDCHIYRSHDLDAAETDLDAGIFKIMLCHSPDLYDIAEGRGYRFYLAGHTHAGQICLPGAIPIITQIRGPRKLVRGIWHHGNLTGLTSSGTGSAGVPARFFTRPEICLITIRAASD